MRKVIVTESQMKYILKEHFNSYLSDDGLSNGIEGNSYGTEVTTKQAMTEPQNPSGKSEKMDSAPTTDKLANTFKKRTFAGMAHSYPNRVCEQSNRDLQNVNFNMDSQVKRETDNLINRNPEERGGIFDTTDDMSANALSTKRTRIKQMKKDNPERYEKMDGSRVVKNLDKQLKLKQRESANNKEVAKRNGQENVYQQAGGTKQANNGKAHSKKNPNVLFTYDNN